MIVMSALFMSVNHLLSARALQGRVSALTTATPSVNRYGRSTHKAQAAGRQSSSPNRKSSLITSLVRQSVFTPQPSEDNSMRLKMYAPLAVAALGLSLLLTNLGPNITASRAASQRDRCATKDLDEKSAAEIQTTLDQFNRNRGQIRKSGSVTVPVYFHVVNKGKGVENGDVPMPMLRAQVDVLNAAYAGATGGADTPYRFVLAGVDRTTNLAWFNA